MKAIDRTRKKTEKCPLDLAGDWKLRLEAALLVRSLEKATEKPDIDKDYYV